MNEDDIDYEDICEDEFELPDIPEEFTDVVYFNPPTKCPYCGSETLDLIDMNGCRAGYSAMLLSKKLNNKNPFRYLDKHAMYGLICTNCKKQILIRWIDELAYPLTNTPELDYFLRLYNRDNLKEGLKR